ncbi:hypothetical protein ACO2I3_08685 [Leptospira interrogans]
MAEEPKADAETTAASDSAKDQVLGLGNPAAAAATIAAATASKVSTSDPEPASIAAPDELPATSGQTAAPLVVEASPASVPISKPTPSPSAQTLPRQVYEASGLRKTLLSLVFLLLLPFFVSLPAMLYQRLTHQLWTDTIGFAIFAGAFALVMLLVVYELIHSLRSRVEINDTALKFTLPAAPGIGMPKLRYRKMEIPYSQIDSVEMRREIYGGSMAPILLRGARVITKEGDKIPLGYISEANVDPTLPLPDIASEVARRCGIEVTDRGNVRREFRRKLRGIQTVAGVDEGIPAAEVESLNRRHHNLVLMLCCGLFLMIAAGVLIDVSKSGVQLGERAVNAQPLKK